MNYRITCIINRLEGIEIILPCEEKDLYRYDEVTVVFHGQDKEFVLYTHDFIIEAITTLNIMLKRALQGKLELHGSIQENIGYLWNEHLQNKRDLPYDILEGRKYWIGLRYSLWETPSSVSPNLITWVYAKNSVIFLEITPSYRWHFRDPEEYENYISYDKFIKNYHSCARIAISEQTAQQWLNKTEGLLHIIEANDSRYTSKS
jgi:hypothetical protein